MCKILIHLDWQHLIGLVIHKWKTIEILVGIIEIFWGGESINTFKVKKYDSKNANLLKDLDNK